eukprot:XP_001690055.1 predicted protein [Chlamydomonas reinhardtii]
MHRIALLSRALSACGLDGLQRPLAPVGSVVVLVAQTSAVMMEAMLACLDAGCILCPVNWRWSVAELAEALQRLSPALVLHDVTCAGLAQQAVAEAGRDLQLQLLAPACGTALLVFTSGTTAAPKGVQLSHAAFHAQSMVKLALVGYCPADTYLHTAPLFHIGGLSSAFAALMAGCVQVFMPRFDAEAALAAILHHRVSVFIAVPTMLQDLAAAAAATAAAVTGAAGPERLPAGAEDVAPGPLGCVRRILVGAGGTAPKLQDAVSRTFPAAHLLSAYGMTEACSSMTFRHLRGPAHPASTNAGGWQQRPQQLQQLQLWAPPGSNNSSKPALTADGWLRTGDLGYLAADGGLWLLGRAKDMIKSGGENVFAPQVEAVLCAHPAVAAAAVVGLPHERLGEQGLAGFRLPRLAVAQWQPLPLNGSGKVAKPVIRAVLQRVTGVGMSRL